MLILSLITKYFFPRIRTEVARRIRDKSTQNDGNCFGFPFIFQ